MTRRKKFILLGIIVTIGLVGMSLPFWFMPDSKNAISYENKANLIRFHVIANSDSQYDQAMKRNIRDLIVAEMTPRFAKAGNIDEARKIVRDNLGRMEEIARAEIAKEGQNYGVKATLGQFNFPIKNYGDFTLPAGEYEAVRIVIGEGQGANWWCVLFPPVCFHDVTKVVSNNDPAEGQPVVNMAVVKDPEKKAEPKIAAPKTKEIKVKFKFVELMQKSKIKFVKKLGSKLASLE